MARWTAWSGTVLWLFLFSAQQPGTFSWTCPKLHVSGVVECSCETDHGLRCFGINNSTSSEDPIETITDHVLNLTDSSSVTLLEVSVPQLGVLANYTFENLTLHGLVITNSQLEEISENALRSRKNLTIENSLQALGFPRNLLRSVPSEQMSHLRQLQRLDLSFNALERLRSDDFDGLQFLADVDVSHNRLVAIEEGTFLSLPMIRKLDLSANRLNDPNETYFWQRCHSGKSFDHLELLSLENNGLSGEINNNTVVGLYQLRTLHLGANNFSKIETSALRDLNQLEILDLSNNQIRVIAPGAFKHLTRLMQLNLNNNQILELLSASFLGLESLRFLELGHNDLTELSERPLANLRNLSMLNVRDNAITYIHGSAFVNHRLLTTIDVEDNPLHCDCKLKGFATWLRKSVHLNKEVRQLAVCYSPYNLRDRPLLSVLSTELICSNYDDQDSSSVDLITSEGRVRHGKGSLLSPYIKDSAEEPDKFEVVEHSLTLTDYQYYKQNHTLVLQWNVDPAAFPFRCDAMIIFEDSGSPGNSSGRFSSLEDSFQLLSKSKIACDSSKMLDPTKLRVESEPGDAVLEKNMLYRFCIVLFSKSTLIPGCSEVLTVRPHMFDAESDVVYYSSTVANPTDASSKKAQEVQRLRENVSKQRQSLEAIATTPQPLLPELPNLHISISKEPTRFTVSWNYRSSDVIPKDCRLRISIYRNDEKLLVYSRILNCTANSTTFRELDSNIPYAICSSYHGRSTLSVRQPATLEINEIRCNDMVSTPTSPASVTEKPGAFAVAVICFGAISVLVVASLLLFVLLKRGLWVGKKPIMFALGRESSQLRQYRMLREHGYPDPVAGSSGTELKTIDSGS